MDTKECTACGADQPLGDFVKSGKTKSGLASICKACNRWRARLYWHTPAGRAKRMERQASGAHKAAMDRYRAKPETKAKIREYEARPERRAASNANQTRWRNRNRLKSAAHDAVRYRVKITGELPRPALLECADCSAQASEYHHLDYAKPLKVIPLCKACHVKRHLPSP